MNFTQAEILKPNIGGSLSSRKRSEQSERNMKVEYIDLFKMAYCCSGKSKKYRF